jgi:hypothetical protein
MQVDTPFPDYITEPKWQVHTNKKQTKVLHSRVKLTNRISVNAGRPNIPGLVIKPYDNLEARLDELGNYVTDFMNGIIGIKLGDNKHSIRHCNFKTACDKGWYGNHNYSHPTPMWIVWDFLKQLYIVEPRSTIQTEEKHIGGLENEASLWSLNDTTTDEAMFYQQFPDELPFIVGVEKLESAEATKRVEIFRNNIPMFFAGKIQMPRIGGITNNKFCQGPFCIRSLFCDEPTACNNLHDDSVSLLTTLVKYFCKFYKIRKTTPGAATLVKRIAEAEAKTVEPQPTTVKQKMQSENKFDLLSLVE